MLRPQPLTRGRSAAAMTASTPASRATSPVPQRIMSERSSNNRCVAEGALKRPRGGSATPMRSGVAGEMNAKLSQGGANRGASVHSTGSAVCESCLAEARELTEDITRYNAVFHSGMVALHQGMLLRLPAEEIRQLVKIAVTSTEKPERVRC